MIYEFLIIKENIAYLLGDDGIIYSVVCEYYGTLVNPKFIIDSKFFKINNTYLYVEKNKLLSTNEVKLFNCYEYYESLFVYNNKIFTNNTPPSSIELCFIEVDSNITIGNDVHSEHSDIQIYDTPFDILYSIPFCEPYIIDDIIAKYNEHFYVTKNGILCDIESSIIDNTKNNFKIINEL